MFLLSKQLFIYLYYFQSPKTRLIIEVPPKCGPPDRLTLVLILHFFDCFKKSNARVQWAQPPDLYQVGLIAGVQGAAAP